MIKLKRQDEPEPHNRAQWKLGTLSTVLLFSLLLNVVNALGVFFFDYFAGSATRGFGMIPSNGVIGTGMFYLYVVSHFVSFLVILPVLLKRRFGIATAVFLPLVIIGFPINYYFEWITIRTWVVPWSGLGWTAAYLLTGLSVDLTYKFAPSGLSDQARVIITGLIMGVVSFAATVAALDIVYVGSLPTDPGSFVGLAYFGLPLMVVNSGFGALTAYAVARDYG